MRLIDADAFAKEIAEYKKKLRLTNQDYATGYFSALSVVEGMLAQAPTISPDDAGTEKVFRCQIR